MTKNINWIQTHCEVSLILGGILEQGRYKLDKYYQDVGRFGLYDLAQDITDRFETMNQGREWDGEWWDELEAFVVETINNL